MTHHHHAPGHIHPPARIGLSILRLSVAKRLLVAAAASAMLWGAAFWAIAGG